MCHFDGRLNALIPNGECRVAVSIDYHLVSVRSFCGPDPFRRIPNSKTRGIIDCPVGSDKSYTASITGTSGFILSDYFYQ